VLLATATATRWFLLCVVEGLFGCRGRDRGSRDGGHRYGRGDRPGYGGGLRWGRRNDRIGFRDMDGDMDMDGHRYGEGRYLHARVLGGVVNVVLVDGVPDLARRGAKVFLLASGAFGVARDDGDDVGDLFLLARLGLPFQRLLARHLGLHLGDRRPVLEVFG